MPIQDTPRGPKAGATLPRPWGQVGKAMLPLALVPL